MAFSFTSFLSIIKTGAEVASAGVDIYAAIEKTKAADEAERVKAAELQRSQKLEAARAKREARIKTASLLASQGAAGVRASTTQFGVVGVGSSLQTGLEELATRTQFNLDSLSAQTKATKAEAIVEGVGGLATGIAAAKNFSDVLTTTFTADNDPAKEAPAPTTNTNVARFLNEDL